VTPIVILEFFVEVRADGIRVDETLILGNRHVLENVLAPVFKSYRRISFRGAVFDMFQMG